ncbi:adenylate kinase isoenzyme 1 [Lasioglossum baleicum]|uniref:adenylate kinase isoenzyme 1 n=1 Tax=Lasioglossum baleicum TaxID=434251 RepID=UPI003FCD3F30
MGNCIGASEPVPAVINVNTEPLKNRYFPVVFLLGGPGAGKRTLIEKVAQKYDFLHLVTADLIRQEITTRTERAFTLARLMSQGQLVPTDVLIELIATKIMDNLYKKKGVIISGFPRRKEQCITFDKTVKPPDVVLYLNVRNSVLSDRIMGRAATTTERAVTNYDFVKKQITEFHKKNRTVVKHYKDRLIKIDGEADLVNVMEDVCKAIDNYLRTATASS